MSKKIILNAVGDVMLGDSPFCIGHGVRSKMNQKGIDHYVEVIAPFFDKDHLNFINLESVISNCNENKKQIDSVEMRGETNQLRLIRHVHWNVVNIANNHIFQHGYQPYFDSVDKLSSVGITVVGDVSGHAYQPAFLKKNGITIGFIGFSLRPEQYLSKSKIPYALICSDKDVVSEIRRVRSLYEGPLVVSLHWGLEFMDQPTKQQQYLARKLIDNGVTVILGHHAHVVQGIEEYKKGLIFYNLGNFIFDLPYQKTEKSYIASVELKREGVESYELRPVVINQDYIPVYMTGYPKTNFLQSIQKLSNKILSAELGDEITLEAVSKKEYNKFRYLCYKYFLRNWNRYPINYFIQSITRAILRRLHIVKNP